MKLRIKIIIFLSITLLLADCRRKEETSREKDQDPAAYLPADNLRLLTGRAGIIFKGVVSSVEYETDAKSNLPFTYVTFRQIEAIKDLTGKFKADNHEKIRVRNFGGLREDGKMFQTSHVPDFMLGAVYVVFYSAGEWDVTPIVGGESGVYRVLKSKTLGHEMLLDYSGGVVVSIVNDSIKTLPIIFQQSDDQIHNVAEPTGKVHDKQNKEDQPFKIDKNSIYTEERVKQMIESEDELKNEIEKEQQEVRQKDSLKINALKNLSSPPMSYEAFSQAVLETDKKYKDEFIKFYSTVSFEGKPMTRERTPMAPKQK